MKWTESTKGTLLLSIGLLIFLCLTMILCIIWGSVHLDIKVVFQIIVNHLTEKELFEVGWNPSAEAIVWELRFPKALVATLVGAGLSLAGLLMQGLTKHSLADPYILGISSGVSTGAVASILIGTVPVIGRLPSISRNFFGGTDFFLFGISYCLGRGETNHHSDILFFNSSISIL